MNEMECEESEHREQIKKIMQNSNVNYKIKLNEVHMCVIHIENCNMDC